MTVKLALIGTGSMGQKHAAAILAAPEAHLCASVDPAGPIPSAANTTHFSEFSQFMAAITTIKPDGVILATPNQAHKDQAIALLKAGIPVLIEKPIADTVEAGRAIAEASEKSGVPALVGHHRRYNGRLRQAKALIDQGAIGDVVAVAATWITHKPDAYFDVLWRRAVGGGPILINLIHDIDSLIFLLGSITTVQAMTSSRQRSFDIEDSAAILLRFQSGILATVTVSDAALSPWSWEHTADEPTARSYPQSGQDCYYITGRDGALAVPSLTLWRSTADRDWQAPLQSETIHADNPDPFPLQLQHFTDIIKSNKSPIVSAADGLQTLRVIEAIQEAAVTKSAVNL